MSAIDIARDFFSSYGIAFCMLDPPRGIGRLDIFHAKTTQGDEYREKPVDRKNASDRFLIPLREFIRTYASPAQRAINVVFVPTLLDERHPLSSHFAELEGFAILPRNLTTVQNFQKHQLVDQIGIDQFTPSVIIDLPAETSDFYPIGMTLAHEVGHVLGLAHVDDTSNLMSASKDNKALRGLNPAQVRALKNALFFSVFQKSKAKTGLNRSRGPSEIE
ncbi:MAG: matrixin family metalloprotease [Myxococcales bacterium]|nr:MAG: matrixin family metalloprotease [Myxococcales bacterium]